MRKPKFKKTLYLLLCTAILCSVSCSRTPQADRIFTNGHIITMNKDIPEVEVKGAYAWRSFLDAGVHVPLNSDFPG